MILNDGGSVGSAPAPGLQSWTASPSTRAALAAGGWNVPQPAQTPATDTLVDSSTLRPLMPHTTQLAPGEWQNMQTLYEESGGTRKMGPYAEPKAFSTGEMQTAEMTKEQYEALTDDQRRAVDFNTLLVEARERDLSMSRNLQGTELDDYNKRVEAIFGEGGGTHSPAPNTLELLEKIQFKAPGQDIDDYLSMEAGVSLDELKDFKLPDLKPVEAGTTQGRISPEKMAELSKGTTPYEYLRQGPTASADLYAELRSAVNRDASAGLAIQKAGEYIATLMKDPAGRGVDTLSAYRAAVPGDMGGKVPFGWSTDLVKDRLTEQDLAKENFFKNAYGYLRDNKDVDTNEFWTQVQNAGLDQAELNELFQYFDDYSSYEERVGVTREGNTPQQIRELSRKLAK